MKITNATKNIIILFSAFILWSCQKNEPIIPVDRTVFIYMAADNTLSPYAGENINEMIKGMKTTQSVDGRLLCLVDRQNTNTQLIEITANGTEVLKDYKQNLNTGLAETFRSTFADVQQLAPAESYGLILWSHGSGWLPVNATRAATPVEQNVNTQRTTSFPLRPIPSTGINTRAFGQDLGAGAETWMVTDDMVRALSGFQFDFILFDACYMASVELLYALRQNTSYFIVSPTEILAVGFPYAEIMNQLFTPAAGMEKNMMDLCQTYFDFYKNQPNPSDRAATIALIRAGALDALAAKIKTMNIDLSNASTSSVQKFNRQTIYPLYDFTDAYLKAQGAGGRVEWESEINNAVAFKRNTDYFDWLRIATCSGLSTYIPVSSSPQTRELYKQTAWYKATH